MTLTQALRYASIFTVAGLLVTGLGTHTLRAQSAGTPSADADSAAKKKADAAKAAAKTTEKPKQPTQTGSSQGYRPDPTSY